MNSLGNFSTGPTLHTKFKIFAKSCSTGYRRERERDPKRTGQDATDTKTCFKKRTATQSGFVAFR